MKDAKEKIDVRSKLRCRKGVQLVQTQMIKAYMEYDRNVVKNPSRPRHYLSQLKKRLVNDGIEQPLILSVSKLTERAYIYEGNHRLAILIKENIE